MSNKSIFFDVQRESVLKMIVLSTTVYQCQVFPTSIFATTPATLFSDSSTNLITNHISSQTTSVERDVMCEFALAVNFYLYNLVQMSFACFFVATFT